MRRWALALLYMLILTLSLCGCGNRTARYSAEYWDTFDTRITITAFAPSKNAFDEASARAHAEFSRLHSIFDRHAQHEGVNGVYRLNQSGHLKGAPEELIEVLLLCRSLYAKTGQRMNPAMGALLEIWDEYRQEGTRVPEPALLQAAARNMDPAQIVIDERTRAISLPEGMRLDLGAVAKGYAVERVAALLQEELPSFLIDAGGNIRVGEAPLDGREHWSIGIADPSFQNPDGVAMRLAALNLSVVSSGGYQRYYEADGQIYHHIIDPDTLMPGGEFLQTTVVTHDSGLADYLTTPLFLLPYEQGRALIGSMDGVDAIWMKRDGSILMTPGIEALLLDGE